MMERAAHCGDNTNRTEVALKGVVGKKLTYRRTNQSRRPQANDQEIYTLATKTRQRLGDE